MPHHHLHVGLPALFILALFVTVVLALILFRPRRDKFDPHRESYRLRAGPSWSTSPDPRAYASPPPRYTSHPPAAPVTVVNAGGGGTGPDGFLTGMLMGEALSGGLGRHETTVINEGVVHQAGSYSDPLPPCDSGVTLDSGNFGSSGCDGGGIDIGW